MENTIKLRRVRAEDGAALLKIYAPYVEKTAISFEYSTPTLQEFQRRIISITERYPYIAAEQGGEILGYAYAGAFGERAAYGWAVEATVYVDQRHKGQGLGRLLYGELERALAAQGVLNMTACIAVPKVEDEYLTNNSLNFHSHLGFRLVGRFSDCGYKFGRWYDVAWVEKMLGSHTGAQPPVVPFPEIDMTF